MGTTKEFRNLNIRGTGTITKTLTASSNATVTGTLAVTKGITASSGSIVSVETVGSTATTAKNYGITVISTTKAGTRKFKIGNPVAGNVKHIRIGSIAGSSSKVLIRCASTKPYIVCSTGGAARRSMNFATSGMGVTLVGFSTGIYYVASHFGAAYGSSFST